MAEFVLRIKDLDAGAWEHCFPVPNAWIQKALDGSGLRADATAGDGTFEVSAERTGADVLVRGRLRAGVVAECVRCLEDAAVAVDVELASLFTARSDQLRPSADEEELTPEELMREFFAGEEIDLDALVRESLILEVPMQPLCREECPGIEIPAHVRPPADFGAEAGDDVDPRLAPLRNLAVKAQGEE